MHNKICVKFESASKVISQKWVGLIIHQLLEGPKRFKDLEHEISISSKVLSDKLRFLEQNDLITRNVYPETPVRIEYQLTQKGFDLQPVMESIEHWANKYYKKDNPN